MSECPRSLCGDNRMNSGTFKARAAFYHHTSYKNQIEMEEMSGFYLPVLVSGRARCQVEMLRGYVTARFTLYYYI